ncbi:hypothetical protein [Achromobacter sp. 79A6]|uniref:hypothetical protein n=1 Tax=unclassified Achromobacter TaxID=2626865 RepID=UPI0021F1854B
MNRQEFIAAIKRHVQQQAVDDLIATYIAPPGRRPSDQLSKIAQWRARLTVNEQSLFDAVISESVRVALFGVFAVVDGVRCVDQGVDRFIISAQDYSGNRQAINEDEALDLHDEFALD